MGPLVFVGGYLTSPGDFAALAALLEQPPYNYRVFVAPIGRVRWALTRDYDFRPVLKLIRATVAQALEATGAEWVTLVAYSVGGVAARLYLGERPYYSEIFGGRRYVKRLITLGTPHHSEERWTLKLYRYANTVYPGAFYDDVHYTSVVGDALEGKTKGRFVERMAHQSYTTVDGPGKGTRRGDGVTSLESAALRGAEYLAVPGLYHSPFHGHPWYGDPHGLQLWGRVLTYMQTSRDSDRLLYRGGSPVESGTKR